MKNKNVIIYTSLLVGIIVFYGGFFYGKSSTKSAMGNRTQFTSGQTGGRSSVNRAQGGMRGNGFVMGEILSKDTTGFIVKLMDGGSKIIFTSASTTVLKTTPGSIADISIGTNVMVQGGVNADGSVTAQSVQIRNQQIVK